MYQRMHLHDALKEALKYLSVEHLLNPLDQVISDQTDDIPTSTLVGQVCQSLGLYTAKVNPEQIEHLIDSKQVAFGFNHNQSILIKRLSSNRFRVLKWDQDKGSTSQVTRTLPVDIEVSWIIISEGPPLSPLANPGGTLPPWKRLFQLIALEKHDVTTVALYAGAIGALSLVTPLATQALVNTIAFGTIVQPLIILIAALFIGLGLSAVLQVVQSYIVEVFQRRILVRAAEDLGSRLTHVADIAKDRMDLVEVNNRFFDIITIQKTASELLLTGLALSIQAIVGFILLGLYHPLLLGFDIALMFAIGAVFLLGRGGTASAMEESRAKFSLASWLDELARNPSRFRGGHGRILASQELENRTHGYVLARRKHYRKVFSLLFGGAALKVVAFVGLLALGGWLVIEQQLTLGQLVASELVVSVIASGVGKIGKLSDKTFDLVAGVDKVGRLLDLPTKPQGNQPLIDQEKGMSVKAKDLLVGYGTQPVEGAPLTFALEPGDKVHVEGPPASGKSALLEALAGWRSPKSGNVLWDDHASPHNDDLATHVWLVHEESMVTASILSNLRLADVSISSKKAWEVLKDVHLDQVIHQLPERLDTPLLPSGSPLSPSEIKRLMIAQALIASPRLLVIDEVLDGLSNDYPDLIEKVIGQDTPWTAVVATNDVAIQKHLPVTIENPHSAKNVKGKAYDEEN